MKEHRFYTMWVRKRGAEKWTHLCTPSKDNGTKYVMDNPEYQVKMDVKVVKEFSFIYTGKKFK
jgi:hypothetical protein